MDVLGKSSDIFRLLSESVSEGMLVVNDKQIIAAANGSAHAMFGYAKNELVGKPLDILIPWNYRKAHSGHFNGFTKGAEKRQMGRGRTLYGCKKNGEEFPVEAGLNPLELFDTKYVMALVTDITERKKSEEALSHWYQIFNESLNEIYVFDATTFKFINVNYGAQMNTGYSLEELRNLTPADIKPDFDEASFKTLLVNHFDGQEPKLEFETIHQRKDGSTYPVEVHLELSNIGDRKVYVAFILDITERKAYTENLERTVAERTVQLEEALAAEKELGELKTKFLSLVSHEFKTPLSSILTSTTLLTKYTKTEQQQNRDKHLHTIKSKVKYLDNILNDFLSVERLESGKVKYIYSTFPLSKVVNEVVYDSNMLLKDGQRILYPQDIDEIILEFDEKILELALSNLVHNAIKYSPEHKVIDIRVSKEKQFIFLHIIDKGIGIPLAEQKFIFERYFRAGNALLNQGTGIGLNIAKRHLENLGGDITFKSIENTGTEFKIKVPLQPLKSES
ncbi:PAS domain S-box protein [Aurantibacter crassamenti]|uniref:sensor histidine kinase n=1 Tax=Aurantibacter crassamenti TaxID=1837375 RepID=UPI001939643C|nr:PAS domain-containing sensor histidine kinase [Aurantibacter crassamenti]MBM1106575.1 PAS domain S-box protein [Aurantibacter crassamenti]